jgi:polyferredoxin
LRTWKTRRRATALAQGVAILSLPFLTVNGESAFRFDIPGLKLLFFGKVLWISEFHLFLLGMLAFLLFSLAVTVVFGRVWCGWLCPQTVLPELASWAVSPFPKRWRRAGGTLLLFPLSGLVSFSLIAYFVPPAEAAALLFRSRILTGFFLAQWAVIFPMLAFLGPTFCRTVCPYSMLQNVVFDRETLTIAFDRSRAEECLRCELCVKACPVRIDIRDGAQRECIACAECIDACRAITGQKGIPPFVAYSGTILRPKAALWGGATVAAGLTFLFLLYQKPPVALFVQWEAKVPGSPANSYRYTVRNDLGRPLALALRLDGEGKIYGDKDIRVGPHARKTGTLVVREEGSMGGGITFVAEGQGISLRRKAGFP